MTRTMISIVSALSFALMRFRGPMIRLPRKSEINRG